MLIVGMAIGTALLILTTDDPLRSRFEAPGWAVAVVAVGFFLAERSAFHIQYRREAISFSLSEGPTAFAIVFLAPVVGLFVRPLAGLMATCSDRRQPLYKLVFNAVLFAFEMSMTFWLVDRMVGSDTSEGPLLVALSLALLVAYLIGSTAVMLAISCFEGGLAARLIGELRTSLLTGPASAAVGAVAVAPAFIGWFYSALSIVPLALGWALAARYGRLDQQHRDLLELHRFTRVLGRSLDIDDIAPAAIDEYARLLRAHRGALVVFGDDGVAVASAFAGPSIDGLPESSDDPFVVELGDSIAVCVWLDGRLRVDPTARATNIAIPIADDHGTIGVVVLGEPVGPTERFDEAAIERASALGAQLAANLRKSLLFAGTTHAANHDALTGGLNRAGFERELVVAIGEDDGRPGGAVLMIDLDRFKEVNDTLGHRVGDRVLIEFADRVAALLRPDDRLARFGGDEFAVLLRSDADPAAVRSTAAWIVSEARRPMTLDGIDVVVTASVGVATIEHHDEPVDVLRRADVAMYAAKRRHSGYEEYRVEIDRRTPQRLSLLGDLREALDTGQIDVHFQPKIELATATVTGVEALARWHHRSRGWVPPDEFVAVAEETGLIKQLTDQVLGRAIAAASGWVDAGHDLSVSVNLSAHDLLDELLVERIRRHLERSRVDPFRLILEITESALLVDTPRTMSTVARLHDLGIGLSLDDFGTGYSSLSYLRRLPVDELKIDRSFVTNLLLDAQDEVIVRSTIDLGHNLGLRVVAEGIENEPVLERLDELGCDLGQGYGISRPLPADLFSTWMRTTQHRVPRTREAAGIATSRGPHLPL